MTMKDLKRMWASDNAAKLGLLLGLIPATMTLAGLTNGAINNSYYNALICLFLLIAFTFSTARWIWIQRSLKRIRRQAAAEAELREKAAAAYRALHSKDTE